jgi:hypothetical protein
MPIQIRLGRIASAISIGSMSLLPISQLALIPQPLLLNLGEGELEFKVPLPSLREGFRVRA